MCLIAFRYEKDAKYPFVFVGNRDEEYTRPTESLHFWEDEPNILAGRDLKRFGTWLGITKTGRLAALLNHPFTDFQPNTNEKSLSRGNLTRNFLTGNNTTEEFLTKLKDTRNQYDGYHLLFGTVQNLNLYSNALDRDIHFKEGLYSLSNSENDFSEFKIGRSKRFVGNYLKENEDPQLDDLLSLFSDTKTNPGVTSIPKGVSQELAIQNTSMFIKGDVFGTVGTTAILVDENGYVYIKEVRYGHDQQVIDETKHSFQLENGGE